MYCTNCGKQLKDGLLFCTQCGRKIKGKEPNSNEEPATTAPVHEPTSRQSPTLNEPVSIPESMNNADPITEESENIPKSIPQAQPNVTDVSHAKKPQKKAIIISAVAIVTAVLVATIVATTGKQNSHAQKSALDWLEEVPTIQGSSDMIGQDIADFPELAEKINEGRLEYNDIEAKLISRIGTPKKSGLTYSQMGHFSFENNKLVFFALPGQYTLHGQFASPTQNFPKLSSFLDSTVPPVNVEPLILKTDAGIYLAVYKADNCYIIFVTNSDGEYTSYRDWTVYYEITAISSEYCGFLNGDIPVKPVNVPTSNNAHSLNQEIADITAPNTTGQTPSFPSQEVEISTQGAETVETDYFTLTFPASWKDKYVCEVLPFARGYVTTVHEKLSYEAGYGGTLVTFEGRTEPMDDYEDMDYTYVGQFVGSNGPELYLYRRFPSDVQWAEDSTQALEQYHFLSERLNDVVNSLTPVDGYTLSTEEPSKVISATSGYIPYVSMQSDVLGAYWSDVESNMRGYGIQCAGYDDNAAGLGLSKDSNINYYWPIGTERLGHGSTTCIYGVQDGVVTLYCEFDQPLFQKMMYALPTEFQSVEPYIVPFGNTPYRMAIWQIDDGYLCLVFWPQNTENYGESLEYLMSEEGYYKFIATPDAARYIQSFPAFD